MSHSALYNPRDLAGLSELRGDELLSGTSVLRDSVVRHNLAESDRSMPVRMGFAARAAVIASLTGAAALASLSTAVVASDPFRRPNSSSVRDWTIGAAGDAMVSTVSEVADTVSELQVTLVEAASNAVTQLLLMEERRRALALREFELIGTYDLDDED
ncbi:hypothetical protein Cs7R123_29710 [Catellatospora sp. TT07R-123]|nr:hypothetical protein Cs7R123_29710 [Catellatospora sp. TT07R-123]